MAEYKVKLPVKYPENTMQIGSVIETQTLPTNVKLKDYIDIIISEVYDPSKYWIQLKTQSEALDKLMDELQ